MYMFLGRDQDEKLFESYIHEGDLIVAEAIVMEGIMDKAKTKIKSFVEAAKKMLKKLMDMIKKTVDSYIPLTKRILVDTIHIEPPIMVGDVGGNAIKFTSKLLSDAEGVYDFIEKDLGDTLSSEEKEAINKKVNTLQKFSMLDFKDALFAGCAEQNNISVNDLNKMQQGIINGLKGVGNNLKDLLKKLDDYRLRSINSDIDFAPTKIGQVIKYQITILNATTQALNGYLGRIDSVKKKGTHGAEHRTMDRGKVKEYKKYDNKEGES